MVSPPSTRTSGWPGVRPDPPRRAAVEVIQPA